MSTVAIVVAGGEGTRMQSRLNKVFLEIDGRSILERSLALFQASPSVDGIVVVARATDVGRCRPLAERYDKLQGVVAGGDVRHRSEFAGLRAIAARVDAGDVDIVLVHDAVRPFASAALVDHVIEGVNGSIGCVPGLPADPHTVVTEDGWITAYPRDLWIVQTPQAAQATWLLEAHNKAARQGFAGTDTASVVEWAGGDVRVVDGELENIKITTPADLELARRIAAGRQS